jgi:hypothetical protein
MRSDKRGNVMNKVFRVSGLLALMAGTQWIAGCAVIAEKTNSLSDERILTESAGVLGYSPSQLKLVARRTSGTNTYAELQADNGNQFNCIINGGNLATFGAINPPNCAKKGETLRSGPGQ